MTSSFFLSLRVSPRTKSLREVVVVVVAPSCRGLFGCRAFSFYCCAEQSSHTLTRSHGINLNTYILLLHVSDRIFVYIH